MLMRRPLFPGMDPWLEHPDIWPGIHNRLIVAIADDLSAALDPRYFVDVESRTTVVSQDAERSARPDLSLVPLDLSAPSIVGGTAVADLPGLAVDELLLPDVDQVDEWYLEVSTISPRELVTVIEVLSPTNKTNWQGRGEYVAKRARVLASPTNLIEIDLLRAGRPMPMKEEPRVADYRILVSRGQTRPRASEYRIGCRSAIPSVPIPLLPEDSEYILHLNEIFHALVERAHYFRLPNYDAPPVPPLRSNDVEWAEQIIKDAKVPMETAT
jgi:Protein of unknown function (DUF4058)